MTTTLDTSCYVRKIQWFCQQGEGFCMHVFSSLLDRVVMVNNSFISMTINLQYC